MEIGETYQNDKGKNMVIKSKVTNEEGFLIVISEEVTA